MKYARDFYDIPTVLLSNEELRDSVLALIESEPMPGKATEGDGRLDEFRGVLHQIVSGEVALEGAYSYVEERIPRASSPHSPNNKVFPLGWGERLVRTQLSRCYNQAVLQSLVEQGETECYVPHSEHEATDSSCTLELADTTQKVEVLLDRLINTYALGNWDRLVKIPNHPHCTHVVVPILRE